MEIVFRESLGKRYIILCHTTNMLATNISVVKSIVEEIYKVLVKNYDVSPDFFAEVLKEGSKALEKRAVQEYRVWAATINQPKYLDKLGEKEAKKSVSGPLCTKIDNCLKEIKEANKNLHYDDEEREYYEIPKIQADYFGLTPGQGICYIGPKLSVPEIEITDEDEEVADILANIINQLRPLEESGYEVIKILKKFMGNRYDPNEDKSDIDTDKVVLMLKRRGMKDVTYADLAKPNGNPSLLFNKRLEKEYEYK